MSPGLPGLALVECAMMTVRQMPEEGEVSVRFLGLAAPWLVWCAAAAAGNAISIPDITLTNQHGQPVHLATELTGDGVAIVNFIFTTCTTICPPMGVNFSRVQKLLDERGEQRVRLVSITVDPQMDTPARLEKWGALFHANARWTLLTGAPPDVVRALKAFGVYTPDKFTHTSVVVMVNARGESTRSDGLRSADELVKQAVGLLPAERAQASAETPAQRYFTDTVLVDQNGAEHRFYSDLIKGKVVVVNFMFTTCKNTCPMMAATFARLQDWLGSRLNTDVYMLSISVDPETDTPERLKAYAKGFRARPGWFFLTGKKDNVDTVLRKLGQYVEQKQDHSNVFLIGNDRTGLWKKAFGMAPTQQTIETLNSVLRDGA